MAEKIVIKPSAEEYLRINRIREEMSHGLKNCEVLCNHVPTPHVIKTQIDETEQSFRDWLGAMGWLDAGYCYNYYPPYLRDAWRREVGILSGYDDPLLAEEVG